jgi:hypothetical protein
LALVHEHILQCKMEEAQFVPPLYALYDDSWAGALNRKVLPYTAPLFLLGIGLVIPAPPAGLICMVVSLLLSALLGKTAKRTVVWVAQDKTVCSSIYPMRKPQSAAGVTRRFLLHGLNLAESRVVCRTWVTVHRDSDGHKHKTTHHAYKLLLTGFQLSPTGAVNPNPVTSIFLPEEEGPFYETNYRHVLKQIEAAVAVVQNNGDVAPNAFAPSAILRSPVFRPLHRSSLCRILSLLTAILIPASAILFINVALVFSAGFEAFGAITTFFSVISLLVWDQVGSNYDVDGRLVRPHDYAQPRTRVIVNGNGAADRPHNWSKGVYITQHIFLLPLVALAVFGIFLRNSDTYWSVILDDLAFSPEFSTLPTALASVPIISAILYAPAVLLALRFLVLRAQSSARSAPASTGGIMDSVPLGFLSFLAGFAIQCEDAGVPALPLPVLPPRPKQSPPPDQPQLPAVPSAPALPPAMVPAVQYQQYAQPAEAPVPSAVSMGNPVQMPISYAPSYAPQPVSQISYIPPTVAEPATLSYTPGL